MRFALLISFLAIAAPAFAERVWLSPEDFEARVASRSVQVFDEIGGLFGTEHFLPNKHAVWQRIGESQCYSGTWAAQNDQICFRYEQGLGNCFRYYLDGDQMVSVDFVAGHPTTTVRNVTVINQVPPTCSSK